MLSIFSQFTVIILAITSIKAQDNPEKEFETYLKKTDETVREIAKKYQQNERSYRIQSVKSVKLINGSISEASKHLKECEKSLTKILLIYSSYLRSKPFMMNDAELIHPKKVCMKAFEAISEYELVMMVFLATHGDLLKNVTILNTELKVINSSNLNATEAQNVTSEVVDQLENLVNASVDFQLAANQEAFNTSNILISLKTRTLNYCGFNDTSKGNQEKGKGRRTTSVTKKTCTKSRKSITPKHEIEERTTQSWKDGFRPVDRLP